MDLDDVIFLGLAGVAGYLLLKDVSKLDTTQKEQKDTKQQENRRGDGGCCGGGISWDEAMREAEKRQREAEERRRRREEEKRKREQEEFRRDVATTIVAIEKSPAVQGLQQVVSQTVDIIKKQVSNMLDLSPLYMFFPSQEKKPLPPPPSTINALTLPHLHLYNLELAQKLANRRG